MPPWCGIAKPHGDAHPGFRLGQQQHAAIRRQTPAIEAAVTFLGQMAGNPKGTTLWSSMANVALSDRCQSVV
jgi:hypothetical protein